MPYKYVEDSRRNKREYILKIIEKLGYKEYRRRRREEDKKYRARHKIYRALQKYIYYKKYPERLKAQGMVCHALRNGKLVRKNCEVCGAIETQAHHEDYSKPLEVMWLCPSHHRKLHLQEVEVQNNRKENKMNQVTGYLCDADLASNNKIFKLFRQTYPIRWLIEPYQQAKKAHEEQIQAKIHDDFDAGDYNPGDDYRNDHEIKE